MAFYYATFYIQSLSVIKDYIMIADAHKSVAFLSWKEDDFALILLGKVSGGQGERCKGGALVSPRS